MSYFDPAFKPFGEAVKREIALIPRDETDQTLFQKGQLERLVELELAYRTLLIEKGLAPAAYELFVHHIVHVKRNILSARPFFRERQDAFDEFISPAIRARDYKALEAFNFNYQFVRLSLNLPQVAGDEEFLDLVKIIETARDELITCNLPLAISRAKQFVGKMPLSHAGFMDFIQLAAEGLISAVDKFVLPYSTVFRSVIIGRASGNFIREYSDTVLHFYPGDRRKLYRANGAIRFVDPDDYEALADRVNDGLEEGLTTASEIQHLMLAASVVSTDSFAPTSDEEGNQEPTVNTYPADESWRPDVRVEERNLMRALYGSISELDLYEQKLLAMKGVDIGD